MTASFMPAPQPFSIHVHGSYSPNRVLVIVGYGIVGDTWTPMVIDSEGEMVTLASQLASGERVTP